MAQGWNPGPGQPQGAPYGGYGQQLPPKKSNAGLIIGIILGIVGLIVVGVIVVVVMAVSGTKKYLESAKNSEAKNNLGAIGRGAVAAYEREQIAYELVGEGDRPPESHVLCGSAKPVPASVPKGIKYQPNSANGQDFETGTATEGWKCLKFSQMGPMYYQYEYRVGGGYKGPKRGGPDPGPDGFEISAEGDLDGDGQTSLFTQTGTVDKVRKTIKLSSQIWSVDEGE